MLTPNLTAIITAGRSALRRADSGAYHPLNAEVLRDVAKTYAKAVMGREPRHWLARALLADAIVSEVKALSYGCACERAGTRSA